MVTKLNAIGDEFYNFIFPMNYIPKYNAAESPNKKGDYVVGEFGITINLKSNDTIHMITSKQDLLLKEINEKCFELSIPMQNDFKAKDINVVFRTNSIKKPSVLFRENPKYPDEVAAMISFIPNSTPEQTEEEKKDDSDDDEKLAAGEFIFLIDRSGSMKGSRMKLAIEAVKLFLASLPEHSLFNIYSFGSKYKSMYETSVEYDQKSLKKARDRLSKFKANMGRTEIFTPLVKI